MRPPIFHGTESRGSLGGENCKLKHPVCPGVGFSDVQGHAGRGWEHPGQAGRRWVLRQGGGRCCRQGRSRAHLGAGAAAGSPGQVRAGRGWREEGPSCWEGAGKEGGGSPRAVGLIPYSWEEKGPHLPALWGGGDGGTPKSGTQCSPMEREERGWGGQAQPPSLWESKSWGTWGCGLCAPRPLGLSHHPGVPAGWGRGGFAAGGARLGCGGGT